MQIKNIVLKSIVLKSTAPFGVKQTRGFTLVEIAIVLVVVGLLLGSILGPLSNQAASKRVKATEAQLQEIHDALMGFVAINGRLPCPAWTSTAGREDRTGTGNCTNRAQMGYVPNVDLGLKGAVDGNTLLLDSWGKPIRYAITRVSSWAYAKPGVDFRTPPATPLANFTICSTATGCPSSNIIAENVVAVILSEGESGATGAADQLENLDMDDDFVSMPPFSKDDFDDIVVWVSPNTLMLQLVKSGWIGG